MLLEILVYSFMARRIANILRKSSLLRKKSHEKNKRPKEADTFS